MTFTYEYVPTQELVRQNIQNCESRHMQQVAYSTFHDALTQICYGCMKVRSNILAPKPLTGADKEKK